MARKPYCVTCGEATENVYFLCDPCCEAETIASCEAQGVPYKIQDPEVLRKIAVLMAGPGARRAS